jgi:hypothetical protein
MRGRMHVYARRRGLRRGVGACYVGGVVVVAESVGVCVSVWRGSGRKKAVFIGINYHGSKAELRGARRHACARADRVTCTHTMHRHGRHFKERR